MALAALAAGPRPREYYVVAGLLALAAIIAPGPLYVLALTVFGLPHVLWELAWLRATYGKQLPQAWWYLLFAILAVQLITRLGAWLGLLASELVAGFDLVTLALVLVASAALIATEQGCRRWGRLLLALGLSALLMMAVRSATVVLPLMLLAIAHNFTPLFLVPTSAKLHGKSARRILLHLFALPVLIVLGLSLDGLWGFGLYQPLGHVWLPSEATWLGHYLPTAAAGILSGLVLAQCLHYYSVIRLLPAATQTPKIALPWQLGAIAIAALLSTYFLYDFGEAKGLYAVAAGFHAWLEWPLILMIISGRPNGELTTTVSLNAAH